MLPTCTYTKATEGERAESLVAKDAVLLQVVTDRGFGLCRVRGA